MASSSVVGHKRSREETEEVSPSCTCMVCLEVLCGEECTRSDAPAPGGIRGPGGGDSCAGAAGGTA